MSTFNWINFVPLLLFILGSESYSEAEWPERNMTWTKSNKFIELQMCASKPGEQVCGKFTWKHQSEDDCSTYQCKREKMNTSIEDNVTVTTSNCTTHEQQFNQIWKDSTCYCSPPNNSKMTSLKLHTTATPDSIATLATYCDDTNSTQCFKLVKMLVGLAATLAVLLVIVTSGWVWTCWMVEKLKKKSTKGSKYDRIIEIREYAIIHLISFQL